MVLTLLPTVALAQPSSYAGQEAREVKALSTQEVEDLLHGRGSGMAKAAELNSYPGPAHALDMVEKLGLDDRQVTALNEVRARMTASAKALGSEIVERERTLDRLFAENRADKTLVEMSALEIGQLRGRLRAVHLAAHLETKALLTGEQVRRYDVLRGYSRHEGHSSESEVPERHRPHGHGE
jgi:Spy/CpxP family protein refolding chaperone